MEQHDLLNNDLLINDASRQNLVTVAKWGKFLAIVGFIFCGLTIIAGIYMASGSASLGAYAYNKDAAIYAGILYLVCGVVMIFPCVFLNKFSGKIQESFKASSQESLDNAFVNLRSMFRFYGIVTIVFLVLFALAFIGGLGLMMR